MSTEPLVVLCVEDDADIATIVELSLALDPGIRLHTAATGEEALEMLRAGLCPDIILLDALLPGASGLDVARTIATGPLAFPVRIAFLTAAVRAQQIAEFRAAGAVDVIAKPFDPLTLASRVRLLLQCGYSDDDASNSPSVG